MKVAIIILFVLAALGPVVAIVWAIIDGRKLDAAVGYDRMDYTGTAEYAASVRRARWRDLILIGGGVVLASVAGILSLP